MMPFTHINAFSRRLIPSRLESLCAATPDQRLRSNASSTAKSDLSRPQGSKRQKDVLAGAVFNASAGNRTRGWPTLLEDDLLMATANFTTKPPMLDGGALRIYNM